MTVGFSNSGAVGESLPLFFIKKLPTAHYKYVYDGQGNIVRSIDILERKEYNYLYEDGKIKSQENRPLVSLKLLMKNKKIGSCEPIFILFLRFHSRYNNGIKFL